VVLLIFQKLCAVQRREKIFFHVGKFFSGDGIARDQDQFHRLRKFMLMQTETFAEQTPRAAACDGAADFFARDDPQFRRRAAGQFVPIGNQAALRQPFALHSDAREIAALREPRAAVQTQAFRRCGGHFEIKPA